MPFFIRGFGSHFLTNIDLVGVIIVITCEELSFKSISVDGAIRVAIKLNGSRFVYRNSWNNFVTGEKIDS